VARACSSLARIALNRVVIDSALATILDILVAGFDRRIATPAVKAGR
jgi:hypothetical protein